MIDPQTEELMKKLEREDLAAKITDSPQDARARLYRRLDVIQMDKQEVSFLEDIEIENKNGPYKLRIYRPSSASTNDILPVLIYYHGGGWVIGSIDSVDSVCRQLCNESGVAIVSVDYHLAPEWKFPCAVEDAEFAANWVFDNCERLKLNSKKIALAGDSAGGNLATVTSILIRDNKRFKISYLLLIYPGVDFKVDEEDKNIEAPVLGNGFLDYYRDHYLVSLDQGKDWRASPMKCPNLEDLPEVFIITAGNDPLHDEALEFSQLLSKAGNKCTFINFERQIHGFVTLPRSIDEAKTAISICASELRRKLV